MDNLQPIELMPVLSAERRRVVCVHEAAHAVVHSFGGSTIYGVEVAPLGATNWTTEGRKGGLLNDLWGVCHISDMQTYGHLLWNDEEFSFTADKKGFSALLREMDKHKKGIGKEFRRSIRANVCGLLAGPISEGILAGEAKGIWIESLQPKDDCHIAGALCELLPCRNELDHLANTAEQYLRDALI